MKDMIRTPLPALLGVALLLMPVGCAKGPSGSPSGGSVTGKQLFITMRVRGQVDLANDFYYVVFNVNGTPINGFTGPVPVVTDFQRSGNGFAGGAFTCYVLCHQNQPQGSNFSVNAISADLLTPRYLARPVQESVAGNTLSFQVPLADIAAATAAQTGASFTEAQISTLQVNFITTNVNPVNPQDTTTKYFDALGAPPTTGSINSVNNFVTLSTAQDTTYTNAIGVTPEQPNDVATYTGNVTQGSLSAVQIVPDQTPPAIANLDIADAGGLPAWSVEIRG